jgi:mannose/cellobiose epimerase-like protein (N-acyl-D-glucosamine 2-epimerase family)
MHLRVKTCVTLLLMVALLLTGISFPGVASFYAATAVATQSTAPARVSFTFSLPSKDLFLDAAWYRQRLIIETDLWNGGEDGLSGMTTYTPDFNGCYIATIDRQWRPQLTQNITIISQSRGIYMNVEAYRADPARGQRFLNGVNKGVECLLKHFKDPQLGGFYWEISPLTGQLVNDMKQGYGNVHPLFALAQTYDVTRNPDYLKAALDQLEILKTRFLDPKYPGGIGPGFSRDFSKIIGVNNVDTFTHYFEALLAMYDVTDGAVKDEIGKMITLEGDFLANRLYVDQKGFTDRGYVAYNYDEEWRPSQQPYTRETQWSGALQASTGHNIELAYLLSRAVERGFNADWLTIAQKLIKFCEAYAIDVKYGGMLYEITDYDGKPLEGNPDNEFFIWWPQLETARAFLHFAVARKADTGPAFKKIERFTLLYLTDRLYGGLVSQVSLDSSGVPQPDNFQKGNVWKLNYHFTMFMREVLRLNEKYPDQIKALTQTP